MSLHGCGQSDSSAAILAYPLVHSSMEDGEMPHLWSPQMRESVAPERLLMPGPGVLRLGLVWCQRFDVRHADGRTLILPGCKASAGCVPRRLDSPREGVAPKIAGVNKTASIGQRRFQALRVHRLFRTCGDVGDTIFVVSGLLFLLAILLRQLGGDIPTAWYYDHHMLACSGTIVFRLVSRLKLIHKYIGTRW